MNSVQWSDFAKIDLRAGTITQVALFPEAKYPAYKLTIDFGEAIGVLRSSAQITALYKPDELVGRQILGVVNFPPKQIGPFMSQCLVTGLYDGKDIVLISPERPVTNGARLG